MNTTQTKSDETRWAGGGFFIRFIHLNCGWRFWATKDGNLDADDVAIGINPNGYLSMDAARRAVAKAAKVSL